MSNRRHYNASQFVEVKKPSVKEALRKILERGMRHTLPELEQMLIDEFNKHSSQTAISARLRELRARKEVRSGNYWQYFFEIQKPKEQEQLSLGVM